LAAYAIVAGLALTSCGRTPAATPPGAQPYAGMPVQSVYNPTPPVKPAAKKTSTGCLSILAGAMGLIPLLGVLLGAVLR